MIRVAESLEIQLIHQIPKEYVEGSQDVVALSLAEAQAIGGRCFTLACNPGPQTRVGNLLYPTSLLSGGRTSMGQLCHKPS